MTVSDIPSALLQQIRLRFESTSEVRTLRTQQQYAQRRGDYRKALAVAERIDDLFVVVLDKYMKDAELEVMTLDSEAAGIPKGDKDEMVEKMTVLFMACDIIDSAVLDLNDILHRTKPDITITAFNDIRQLSDMARRKLEHFQRTGGYMGDLVWADKCDDMYAMMQSKTKAIIKKRNSDPKWGENMKKLM